MLQFLLQLLLVKCFLPLSLSSFPTSIPSSFPSFFSPCLPPSFLLSLPHTYNPSPVTPDSDHAQPMSLKVARAFSSRRYSLRSEHLLSEQGGMISPSPSSTYLKGKDLHEGITVDDVVQKLQVETNIFIQTDYLHYLFNRWCVLTKLFCLSVCVYAHKALCLLINAINQVTYLSVGKPI